MSISINTKMVSQGGSHQWEVWKCQRESGSSVQHTVPSPASVSPAQFTVQSRERSPGWSHQLPARADGKLTASAVKLGAFGGEAAPRFSGGCQEGALRHRNSAGWLSPSCVQGARGDARPWAAQRFWGLSAPRKGICSLRQNQGEKGRLCTAPRSLTAAIPGCIFL